MENILLIRHLESVKNVHLTFSSEKDIEPLTEKGRSETELLADNVKKISELLKSKNQIVYTANSARAIASANNIREVLDAEMIQLDELVSIKYKAMGISEDNLAKDDPKFLNQLNLYRAGLFSSYNIETPRGSEKLSDFEKRIGRCLEKITESRANSLKIVVTHRSPITAILIKFARQYHQYPEEFFGYVELSLGRASLIKKISDDQWSIQAVNKSLPELIAYLEDLKVITRNSDE